MSNSSLVTVTMPSPNKGSRCGKAIDTITIHCTAGQGTAEEIGQIFSTTARRASSNYGIGQDGSVGLYVDESERSWCTNSRSNDSRAVTIEVSSEPDGDCEVSQEAYSKLIELVTDVCRRNGIKKLIWSPDSDARVNHEQGANITCHRDFTNKACPGNYLYSRMPEIAKAVNSAIGASGPYIVSGDEAPSITGEAKGTDPENPEEQDECSDQNNIIPPEKPTDNEFGVAKMLLNSLLDMDDDKADAELDQMTAALTKKLAGIDNSEELETLDGGDSNSIAKAASGDVGGAIGMVTSILNGLEEILPGPFASLLGLGDLKESIASLTETKSGDGEGGSLRDIVSDRIKVNRQFSAAYPESKANPATAVSSEMIEASLDRKATAEGGNGPQAPGPKEDD